MKKLISAIALAATAAATPALADDYQIDTKGAHASINFKIAHLGTSWLLGRFNTFSGDFSFDNDDPSAAKIALEIDTASIDSNHAERDKHLRSDEFLHVAKYPKATFVSTGYQDNGNGGGTLKGDLTLHGVTKNIEIDVEKVGEGADPWGGYRMGFAGTTELKLKDFGINYNLGPASETVYMDLHIEGVRK
ncbi:YceI family protein [Marinobacterium arenosum]|uniref:YceI family protein n=1 Tax=Marinobacterium arenosum TaxID=2862496 RepID=UPI001C9514A0|nr:YceI family protein [Marinobacterium arenosum]MBY4678104.1 YceI family protein [Marinobacterium arenosum]